MRMSVRKILLIACCGMGILGWQVSSAQAGMIQNMLQSLKQQSLPAQPAHQSVRPGIPAQELLPVGFKVDEIVVYKSERRLELRRAGKVVRSYRVALGRNPVGHKLYQGDNRTPEGRYIIDMRNARSAFYRSMRISYPDRTDQDVALTVGLRPGDWIMIHGIKNGVTPSQLGHPYRDWTNGCIALTNREMDEVWDSVAVGTPITIWP